jgi:uncharacterized protein
MANEKVKVIFDCNIFLQAFLSNKGTASKCLKLVEDKTIELYLNRDIFNEIKDVLSRPEFQAKFPHATLENLSFFLEYVQEKAFFIRTIGNHFELLRDRKDEKYINLAIEIKADFIVSWDTDLLDLMTDISIQGKEFRQKSRPLRIVEPIEFLDIITKRELPLNP